MVWLSPNTNLLVTLETYYFSSLYNFVWRWCPITYEASILFEIAKNIFVWSMANFATYTLVYGYVGTIVALMTWTYVSAVILLFCAKITSCYPKIRHSLAAEALADESAREKLMRLAPSTPAILMNMSTLTTGGVGALRRLMLGKS